MDSSKYLPLIGLLLIISFASCKESQNAKKAKTIENKKSEPTQAVQKDTSSRNTINNFIPKDYFLLDSASSLTKNGNRFIALVLAHNSEKNTEEITETKRQCIVLEEKSNALNQVAMNDELVLCKSCGGAFGDPYNGIELNKNILKISNYGGSAWRWSENYIFRYQNEQWELIGATYESYYNAKECDGEVGLAGRQLEDINFAAGKMQIIHTNNEDCQPFEDYLKKFEKKKPISFSDFPGIAAQWPSGKIKDGDGKSE